MISNSTCSISGVAALICRHDPAEPPTGNNLNCPAVPSQANDVSFDKFRKPLQFTFQGRPRDHILLMWLHVLLKDIQIRSENFEPYVDLHFFIY